MCVGNSKSSAQSPSKGAGLIDGLNPADPGWQMMVRALDELAPDSRLFAYCGIAGHCEGTRMVLDLREHAVSHPKAPVASFESLRAASPGFQGAAVWPRAHLGKDFTELSLAQAGLLLADGGALWMAARKSKGAKSLAEMLSRIFGKKPDIVARQSGYALYRASKSSAFSPALANEILDRRYLIEDPRLPAMGLVSAPGVFSRKALDKGTAALIDAVLEEQSLPSAGPRRVLDLCCGVGTLACFAAARWPDTQVLGVDSNQRAVSLAQENANRLGLASRMELQWSDGLPASVRWGPLGRAMQGRVRLALVNPPTHASHEDLVRLLGPLRDWLGPGAKALLVVARPGSVTKALQSGGACVTAQPKAGYQILHATWLPS